VSAGYFETMEMRVLRGRGIQRIDDERAPPVVVVSDGLARRLSPNGDIIGRRIRMGDGENPWRTVIGVVNETRESFTADAMPDVFVPYAQSPSAFLSIVVRTDRDEATLIEPIKRAVASVDAVLAMSEVESMSAVVARQTSSRRGMTALLSVFSGLALGLSVLGLYASLSYMVVQRRPELAVRLAVGADARAILRLVVGEGLLTAAFGVVTGAVASLLLGRILQNQVYGVSTTDPLTLGVIAADARCGDDRRLCGSGFARGAHRRRARAARVAIVSGTRGWCSTDRCRSKKLIYFGTIFLSPRPRASA
jgi:ABC-type antimicrobial peptide transport system permease subunit